MARKIILGTRGSKLALKQAEKVVEALTDAFSVEVEVKTVKSFGDIVQDRALYEMPTRGVFVKKLDALLISRKIDIAVHSMKDIPLERPPSLETAAVLPRDAPYDVLISNGSVEEMPEGAVVGTSSVRRRLQMLHRFPVNVKDIRGNVDTRLRKLRNGEYDAIILAEAGIQRLGLEVNGKRLCGEPFVPAPNQGIIAVVSRLNSKESEMLREIDDAETRAEASAEEEVLRILGGGCATPVGVLAKATKSEIELEVYVGISPKKYIYKGLKVRRDEEYMDKVRAFAMKVKSMKDEIVRNKIKS